MENVNLVEIILAAISLIGLLFTYYAIPILRSKTTVEKRKEIISLVEIAVRAAEQMKEAGLISIPKKTYVLNFLKSKGLDITHGEMDAMIEAAVFELERAKNELIKDENERG